MTTTHARKALGMALALAVCLGVGACGGTSPSPAPLKKTSSTPTSDSPEPSPSATKSPNASDAVGAVKRWIAASNQARRSLDPTPMLTLSGDGCDTCHGRAQQYTTMKKNGQHFDGAFDEQFVSATPVAGHKPLRFLVTVKVGAWKVVGKGGKVSMNVGASTTKAYYDMEAKEGTWLVSEITGIQ